MPRPSWDEYFMGIARQVAQRSASSRATVGALIVQDRRILSTGYHGAPRGLPHCEEIRCGPCQRALHAEQNSIDIQAALHGVAIAESTLYITHQPRQACAKMIINAGILRVVYTGDYPDELARSFLNRAGIELLRIDSH